jgi:hypothetical protein
LESRTIRKRIYVIYINSEAHLLQTLAVTIAILLAVLGNKKQSKAVMNVFMNGEEEEETSALIFICLL